MTTSAKDLFSESLTQVDMDKFNQVLDYLKKINTNKCSKDNNILKIFSIDGKDQFNNSCVISSYLKSVDLKLSEENILIGNKQLQQVFYPMDILSDSRKSANGVIALSGLKGSEKFIIVKYPLFDNPYPILKELAVGLKMNELRLKIPNIMYTYGGLYCSSPVDMDYVYAKVEKKLEERFVFMMLKLFIDVGLVSIDSPDDLDEYKSLFSVVGEELSQKIMMNINMMDKKIIRMVFDNIRMIVNEEYELLEEIRDDEVKQEKLEKIRKYEVILKEVRDNKELHKEMINVKNMMYMIYNDEIKNKVRDFDSSLFCNGSVLSTLLMGEYIPNSLDLETAWYSMEDEEEQFKVVCQIIFTLNMAWHSCKFVHNDLHEKNVMVRKLDDPIYVYYDVVVGDRGEKEIVRMTTSNIAVLIDLGDARINDNGYEIGESRSNYNEVLSVMEMCLSLNEGKDNKVGKLSEIYDRYKEYIYEEGYDFIGEMYNEVVGLYKM
jgi:hypothetical protein